MGITGVTLYAMTTPSSPAMIFVSFNVRLMDPKPLFKTKCKTYILMFTITASYYLYINVYNYYIVLNI